MRKLLILALLAATTASPVLAQERAHRERGPSHQRAERPMRAERPVMPQRQETPRRAPESRPLTGAALAEAYRRSPETRRDNRAAQIAEQRAAERTNRARDNNSRWNRDNGNRRPETTRPTPQEQRRWNGNERDQRNWNERDRNDRRWNGDAERRWDQNRDRNQNWNRDRNQNWNRDRNWDRNDNRWNRDWRNDRRYDWQRYRTDHRQIYRQGRYSAPRGWHYGYRRYNTGIYLNSMLFGSNYWIGDPWQYRLPPAYGPYRWVRYFDDVLLVDVRNGYVVDTIYDFFW